MRFASFLSGGFITAIVVNPPERKLAKRTSVHCATGLFLNRGSDVIFFSNVRIAKLFTSVSDFAPQGDDF